jgi:DNA-binding NarL/FixJ family response regulator
LAEEPAGGDEPVRHGGILIVDDCTLYRENLAVTLAVNGLAVSSSAWDLPSLTAALALVRPGIVLMSSATRDSANLLRVVTRISRESRVIVLGVTEDDEAKIVSFAEAGVVGYHMRSDTLDDLVTLIRRVTAGESVVPPRISAVLLRRLSALATGRQRIPRKLVLTNREVQILRMLELGLSNRDIAARLDIAVHTVKNHVHSLLSKLGVSTRAEAAAVARGYR